MTDNEKEVVVEATTNEQVETKEEVVDSTRNNTSEDGNEKATTSENVETDSSTAQIEQDDEDIEFDDSDTADEESKQDKSKFKSARERNRQMAKERRARDSYNQGVKDTLGNVNPYTGEKFETDDDIQVYLNMKEMESKGLDPTSASDYIKFTREKAQAQEAESQRKLQAIQKEQQEIAEVKAKYPNLDIKQLIETDENWANAIIPQIMNGKTLLEAYESVNNLINASANSIAEEKAKKQAQINASMVGSLTNGEKPEEVKRKDYKTMSTEDFNKEWKELMERVL